MVIALGQPTAIAGETSSGPSYYSTSQSNPYVVFDKGTTTNSSIRAYASYGADRYRLVLRAGSGTTTNDCQTNQGWLPNGNYYPTFYNKTWGSTVVRGHVWYLGNKTCSGGSVVRTELFIHSNGTEGTAWDYNYSTQGCIKIGQGDRDDVRSFLRSAYNRDSETISVIS